MAPRHRLRAGSGALAAALLVALLGVAHADDGHSSSVADDVFVVSFVGSMVVAATAVPFMIGNGVIAGRGQRPALAWRLGGWISAGLTLAWGLTATIAYAEGHHDIGSIVVPPVLVLEGLVAGTTIGMTAWATTRPAQTTPRVTVAPLVAEGLGGISLRGAF